MKKIGLIGGIGPASTVEYYLKLIEKCRTEQGETVYPDIVIDSVNMTRHDEVIESRDYDMLSEYILASLGNLKAAGAEVAAITANTEHIIWDEICERFPLPVVSIVDASVNEAIRMGYEKVLVFGTAFTLKSGLYDNALRKHSITPVIPAERDTELIGNLIYPNLENGVVVPEDRQQLIDLAEKYIVKTNADALLLGCTELPLAIRPGDVSVPVMDTTEIHVNEIYYKSIE